MKNTNQLPPIPITFSHRWRELRIQVIPILVFAAVVCGAALLWRTLPQSGDLRGVGEGLRSVVISPRVGVIQRLEIQPYQWVKAGEPVAILLPFDPDAQLDLLQSELQLTRLRLEPSMADQNALNFEQVRVDWMRLREEVAMAKANLDRAESALARNETLIKEKLVSRDAYELSLRDRNFYQAEVTEKTASMREIDKRLGQLRAVGEPQSPGTNQGTAGIIARLEQRMAVVQTNWSALTLVAPISGQVQMIARQENEFVAEGEPLVMIVSPRSDRIVAYLRQPFSFEPVPGMPVEVLIQNGKQQSFSSQIAQVGAQLEAITNALAYVQPGALVDMGLPIVVVVPQNVQLRPGEIVTIALRSQRMNPFGRNRAGAGTGSNTLVQLQ